MPPPPKAQSPPQNESVTALLISIGLAVVVLVLYAQTRSFEFLTLDDQFVLVQRAMVRNGLSWEGLSWAMRTIDPDWYPVTWLSHQLCFTLFGLDAGGHHLVNAVLHAANAVLLFLAMRALSGALWPSALVAALFALHPTRAESVAWVTERKDTMSGLWWMVTLLAYAWYARRPGVARYAAVTVAFILGLMSKPMLVSLPFVLLLLDLWPLARVARSATRETGDGRRETGAAPSLALPRDQKPSRGRGTSERTAPVSSLPSPVSRLLLEKVPLLVLAVAVSATTVVTLTGGGGVRSMQQVSLAWRLLNPPIGYAIYLWQTLWPTRLAVMYPHPAYIASAAPSDYAGSLIAAIAVIGALTALCVATWRTRPYLAVGWFWYLGTLVPVIGVLAVGRQWHADRFTYLPLIGIYIMIAWSLRDLVAARPQLRLPVVATAALAVIALTALSWRQIATFRDTRTLFEHALTVTENNYFAHQTVAAQLRTEGDLAAARRHLDEALRISPDSAYALEQLGMVLEAQGDRSGAATAYERALALSAKSSIARRNLLAITRAEGRREDEIALLANAARQQPTNFQFQFDLGTALLQAERHADAAEALQRAAELRPDNAQAHNNLGVALAKQGRLAEAAVQFERALALNPGHPSAGRSLEWVRGEQRKTGAAQSGQRAQ
jgi:Flp pilus assembly protein TadD